MNRCFALVAKFKAPYLLHCKKTYLKLKNTFFCLVDVDHRKVQDGRCRPVEKTVDDVDQMENFSLHFSTGRPSCTFLRLTSTAAFFSVDSRQPFSSRPLCHNLLKQSVILEHQLNMVFYVKMKICVID